MRQYITIVACIAVSTVLGTIHAFSMFLPEWEQLPGASRASVSLVYSVALLSLTLSVLLGYRVYEKVSPSVVFITVGVLASMGLLFAANSTSLASLYVSYGLLFGGANGLGYGYALQLSGQVASRRRGLAMVLVTAFYAVGATAAPLFFALLIERDGNALALKVVSFVILGTAIAAAMLVQFTSAVYRCEPDEKNRTLPAVLVRARLLFWIGYGCAVAAGLMVIGHAYGIAIWLKFDTDSAAWASTMVAFGNMLGGYSAGYYVGRVSSQVLLRSLPLVSAAGLLILLLPFESVELIGLVGLALIGYSYGALIAVYPVAVADVFGTLSSARIYGQIFTAWGLAGLLGPWTSGWLFDHAGTYSAALVLAVLLSIASSIAIRVCLPKSYAWNG